MALKQFQAESKRLLDLMINSIYTNKEIFLREVISNASDAIDKLHFISLTDENARRDFSITIERDASARTLSVSDNGIGMSAEELESNLGTIAKSGTLEFKKNAESKKDGSAEELIGQFGVGFYACFMVADEVTVVSRKYGEDCAHKWVSKGADGYEITDAERGESGTTVTLKLKADGNGERYSQYLDEYTLRSLVKHYSDYIRYPIRMEVTHFTDEKDDKGKPVTRAEIETLNSMLPIWKRRKGEVTDEEYRDFYADNFADGDAPAKVIATSVEGAVSYSALLFIPSRPPFDYYTKAYKRGLKLYSNGVLIMDNCEKLLPDWLGFVRGVVDSSDLSLNISREMLQHDRQLAEIAKTLEKKMISELSKWMESDRAAYEKFFADFGITLKFGAYEGFGMNLDKLKDLLMYKTASGKTVTLKEYVAAMPEGQKDIYYASGSSDVSLTSLPQVTAVVAKGYDVLLLTANVDEFVIKLLGKYGDKELKSVSSDSLDLSTEEEKTEEKKTAEASKELLGEVKTALSGKVSEVRLSSMLGEYASGLSAKGELSIEMAKVLASVPGNEKIKAEYVLELNPSHKMFSLLRSLSETDKTKFGRLCVLLYAEALLTVGIEPENPGEFVKLVNEFIG